MSMDPISVSLPRHPLASVSLRVAAVSLVTLLLIANFIEPAKSQYAGCPTLEPNIWGWQRQQPSTVK